MRKAKDIITESFPEYILSDNDLELLHKLLLGMVVDIHRVCEKYGLVYFLSGGSLLGAVRHQGFIPWDDDIDLMMPVDDYYRIGKILSSEYGDKYTMVYERSSIKDPTTCAKVYLTGSVYREMMSSNWEKRQEVFVDIFAIMSCPDSAFIRQVKGKLFDVASHCAILKVEYKYKPEILCEKAKDNCELAKYVSKRRMYGRIANLMPMRVLYWMCKKLLSNEIKNSKYLHIPDGIRYNREVLPYKIFDGNIDVNFEGYKLKAPIGYQEYLENLYGDYMQIPPPEKRERHIAIEFKAPREDGGK